MIVTKNFSAEKQCLSDHSLLCMTYNDFFCSTGLHRKEKHITKDVAFFFSFSLSHAKEENNHTSSNRDVHRGSKAVATVMVFKNNA